MVLPFFLSLDPEHSKHIGSGLEENKKHFLSIHHYQYPNPLPVPTSIQRERTLKSSFQKWLDSPSRLNQDVFCVGDGLTIEENIRLVFLSPSPLRPEERQFLERIAKNKHKALKVRTLVIERLSRDACYGEKSHCSMTIDEKRDHLLHTNISDDCSDPSLVSDALSFHAEEDIAKYVNVHIDLVQSAKSSEVRKQAKCSLQAIWSLFQMKKAEGPSFSAEESELLSSIEQALGQDEHELNVKY